MSEQRHEDRAETRQSRHQEHGTASGSPDYKQPSPANAKKDEWLANAAGIAAFLFMFLMPRLLPGGIGTGIAYGTFFGALVGLWPHILARKQGRQRLSAIALISCAVVGAISGLLLAVPVALGFVFFIRRTKTVAESLR